MKFIRAFAGQFPALLEAAFRRSSVPLRNGDREAAARFWWTHEEWPTLYREIPADIRRPVVWDGRLLGGTNVTWLAWHHMTPAVIVETATKAGLAALRLACLYGLAVIAVMVWARWTSDEIATTPFPGWAWSAGAYGTIAGWGVIKVLEVVTSIVGLATFVATTSGILFLSGWYFGFWRSLKKWWNEASGPLRTPTRDATLIWKSKADIRRAEYTAYCRQVDDAAGRLASLPIIPVGTATGVLRARGDMESPSVGQSVAFDGESLRNHTIILGATGTGKTRLVIKPLFDRIMRADWGPDHRIGAYVTDGKGTLHVDVHASVAHRDDVRVIGTGEGEYGVNLLGTGDAQMTPLEVATTFKSVAGAVAGRGTGGDDFWPESASLKIMHSASIARVLEQTEEGRRVFDATGSVAPYSLVGIGRLASDDDLMALAASYVCDVYEAAEREGSVAPSIIEGFASAAWTGATWGKLASQTKSGIVANVNSVLGKLTGAGELARRFCSGTYERSVDVDHALKGGVILVAVGETEWGMAGRVVNTWLKTRLYVLARRRLIADPQGCKKTSCAMIADEFQMLITTGAPGADDLSFWNIARETGLFLVCASQNIAVFKQVIGVEATDNFLNLMRSKIVLKTEELSTIEYIRKLAGELPRGWETESDFFATQGARELQYPDRTPKAPTARKRSCFFPTYPGLPTHPMREAVRLDKRFMNRKDSSDPTGQAAHWRQEDKIKDVMIQGLTWRSKIESDELLLGNGYAFAIVQRAGGDRSDIIDLHGAS